MIQIGKDPGVGRGAFFDLERTLTADATEQVAALANYRQGELGLRHIVRVGWVYLKYNLGLIDDFDTMKRFGAQVFAGREIARDQAVFQELYQEELAKRVHPQARQLVSQMQSGGIKVFIVSATYRFMVAPYAADLQVDGHFGTNLATDDGVCTGEIAGRIHHQHHKADCVRELAEKHQLSLEHSFAFGDSTSDLQMLEAVGHPVAVNPRKGLWRVARERGWPIETWG